MPDSNRWEVDWQSLIMQEIEQKCPQRVVAQTYSYLLGKPGVDWPLINKAIIARWSVSGLSRVKEMAWRAKPHG